MEEQEDLTMYPMYYMAVIDAYTERRTLAIVTSHPLPTDSQTDHANAVRNVSQFLFRHYPQADWIDLHRPTDMKYVGRTYPRAEL